VLKLREPEIIGVTQFLKAAIDPENIMNPGKMGL